MKEIINKIFQKNVWRRFPLCFLKRRYFKAHKIEPLDALRCFTSKLTWLTFIQMIKNRLPFSLTIKNYICKTNTYWGARQNGKSNMILFPLSRYSPTSTQSAMYNKLLTINRLGLHCSSTSNEKFVLEICLHLAVDLSLCIHNLHTVPLMLRFFMLYNFRNLKDNDNIKIKNVVFLIMMKPDIGQKFYR